MKPFVTAVDDYHEFEDVVRHFKNAGINLKFEEVGCGFSDLWEESSHGYHAVFYQNKKEALPLLQKWKEVFKNQEEDQNHALG